MSQDFELITQTLTLNAPNDSPVHAYYDIKFTRAKVTPIHISSRLNCHLLNRLLRKLQDRIDLKCLQVADPEGNHRNGFSNRNARHEIFTFIDTALSMFANRISHKLKNIRVEIQTNIDFRNQALPLLQNIEELEFIPELAAMILDETTNLVRGNFQIVERDGYHNPFLFSVDVQDNAQFIRAVADLMHEALLQHYKEVLFNYREQITGLSDHDRTPRVNFHKAAMIFPESLDQFQGAVDMQWNSSYVVPWIDQTLKGIGSAPKPSTHVNDTRTVRRNSVGKIEVVAPALN